jgi:hypothetical protein
MPLTAMVGSNESKNFNWELLVQKAKATLADSAYVLNDTLPVLQRARELASVAGLNIDSSIIEQPKVVPTAAAMEGDGSAGATLVVPPNTGGFSNTDHIIQITNDATADRIASLKRNLIRRHRSMQPENRRESRWDKPKVPGERRRRIVLEKDQDDSPPEPPIAGWSIFVGQMTTKFRHDEPNVHHNQSKGKVCSWL